MTVSTFERLIINVYYCCFYNLYNVLFSHYFITVNLLLHPLTLLKYGFISYIYLQQICEKLQNDGYVYQWDEEQSVPYIYGHGQWIGFDDYKSITKKVCFFLSLSFFALPLVSLPSFSFSPSQYFTRFFHIRFFFSIVILSFFFFILFYLAIPRPPPPLSLSTFALLFKGSNHVIAIAQN